MGEPLGVRRKIALLKFLCRIFLAQLKIDRDVYLKHVTNKSARLNLAMGHRAMRNVRDILLNVRITIIFSQHLCV